MMKKLSCLLITAILLTAMFASTALATTDSAATFTQEEYQKLKGDGVIGDDVSYEDLVRLNEKAKYQELQLDKEAHMSVLPRGVVMKPGDVIITNSTSSAGLTGHAGIAISGSTILHIPGLGESVRRDSVTTFKNRYNKGWIRVYRINDATAATKAANWASNTYRGTNAVYKITNDLSTTHETYCSKIVWQAYYYGIGKHAVHPNLQNYNGLMPPYDLPTVLNGGAYTMSLIGDL